MSIPASFETNFRAYFAMYDGTQKEMGCAEMKIVDTLFDDDLQMILGDKTINKTMLFGTIKAFLADGVKCNIEMFKILDDSHVEYKVHIKSSKIDTVAHSIGDIKNGKLYAVNPFDAKVYEELFSTAPDASAFEANFRAYFAMFDGTQKEMGDAERKLADKLFDDDFQMHLGDKIINKTMHIGNIKSFLEDGLKCNIEMFKILDDSHVEYKVHLKSSKIDSVGHSIGKIKNGKLCAVNPFDTKAYKEMLGTSPDASTFEANFRAYFAMYDGTQKEMGDAERKLVDTLFDDDLQMKLGDKTINKTMLMGTAKSFLAGGLKCNIEMFKILDDSHVEYKVHLKSSKIDSVGHSIGEITNGKLCAVNPCDTKAYKEMFDAAWKAPAFEAKLGRNELANA